MGEKEKAVVQKLADAINILPDCKRERLIGYAEGVADMQARSEKAGDAKKCEAKEVCRNGTG